MARSWLLFSALVLLSPSFPSSWAHTVSSSGPGVIRYLFTLESRCPSFTKCSAGKHARATVIPSTSFSPASSPHAAPPPTSGAGDSGFFPSLPHHARSSAAPSTSPGGPSPPLPGTSPRVAEPPLPAGRPGGAIPFISSNPALPLPSGEEDAAASRALPVTGGGGHRAAETCPGIQMPALLALAVALVGLRGI